MNPKTTIALLAILAALIALFYLRPADTPKGSRGMEKMAAGYEASKIARIRIDNVDRNEKIVLARAGGDDWNLEEPIRVPADAVGARFLATYLGDYEGTPVGTRESVKLDQLGLDAPRSIVEFEAEAADTRPGSAAKVQRWVVKIGADDLKGSNVFLQVGDRVYKAPRTIYNSVSKSPSDFRDRRVFTLTPLDVTSITIVRNGETTRLQSTDGEWRMLDPFQGKCDAARVSRVIGLTGMRIEVFENDLPGDLTPAGLEPPALRITLASRDRSEELLVGAHAGDRIYVQRAGNRSLWSVARDFLDAALEASKDLRDPNLFGSFSNESVTELRWKLPAAEVEFTRDPVSRTVRLTKPRTADADRDAFEAVLKALQGLKADAMVSSVGANLADFGLAPPLGSLELKLKDAQRTIHLDVGATRPEGTFLRRPGDDYLLRVPAAAFLALSRSPMDFVSRTLVSVSTYEAGHVEIDAPDADGRPRKWVFQKNESNRWVRAGETEEAKGFADVVEALLHVKATDVLAVDVAETPLASPAIEARVYRRLYNDPKGADKEKDRIATLRFSQDPEGNWYGLGITGNETHGGIAMRVSSDVPSKLQGLSSLGVPAPESTPASLPASSPASSER